MVRINKKPKTRTKEDYEWSKKKPAEKAAYYRHVAEFMPDGHHKNTHLRLAAEFEEMSKDNEKDGK